MRRLLTRWLLRGHTRCPLCRNGLRGVDTATDEELAAYAAACAEEARDWAEAALPLAREVWPTYGATTTTSGVAVPVTIRWTKP